MARILPSSLRPDERGHRVGDRGGLLLPVRLIEIDVVRAEPLEASLKLLADALGPQALVDLLLRGAHGDAFLVGVEEEFAFFAVPDHAALGGQDDLVAAAADGPADDLFGAAEAVDGGRVDQVDAVVQRGVDGLDGLVFVGAAPHPAADRPGAEADRRDVDARKAEFAKSMVVSFLKCGRHTECACTVLIHTAGRSCAGPEIGGLEVGRAEGVPRAGAENVAFRHVVHAHGYSKDRGKRDQLGADVAEAESPVVGAPGVHHRVAVLENALAGQPRGEPGGRPGRIGALVERLVGLFGQFDGPALGDLEHRAKAGDEIHPGHRHRHLAAGDEMRRESAAAEILGNARIPGGGVEALAWLRPR